jgi:uncharacterized protein YbaR (Trm112 family)
VLMQKVHRMKMHTMNMLACKVDEHDLLYWVEYKKNSHTR